jgi:hypothetical protein
LLWAKLVLLIGFALTLNLLQPEPGKVEQDTIDLSVEFQTIEHFGASDCWTIESICKFWSEQNKQRIADLLFSLDKGIGLSCWRFNIGAGLDDTMPVPYRTVESFAIAEGVYDWSRCAGQRWFLRAAKNRGVCPLLSRFRQQPAEIFDEKRSPLL